MRRNPERLAWTVLWAAVATFCILIAGIPLAVRSYLISSTADQKATMQVIEGTVLLQKARGGDPVGVTASAKEVELSQGDEVITDGTSWATIRLFDRSNVILYGNSDAKLVRSEAPRFKLSDRPNRIDLSLVGGLMRVGVALPSQRTTEFRVLTPHAAVDLQEGSYRMEVMNDGTQLTVVSGQASVGRSDVTKVVPQGTRTWIDLSGVPTDPVPAARNLILNGDFQEPLSSGWITDTLVYDPKIKAPTVQVIENSGRKVVRFARRETDDGKHTEASIEQELGLDVRDFTRLAITLDTLLDFQSLSGGGQLSSEFPIQVRLDYKDRWGKDKFWTHGFYYQNQQGFDVLTDPWGQPFGEQIPRGVWYPYESDNLLDSLGENRPVYLTGLKIYASGWNYESLVSEVQLIVE